MRGIELWINGVRADLSEASLIQWNYTAEELDNPTTIRNAWSQSVRLPGTATNNRIFADYFRSDRRTGAGQYDVFARVPFVIYSGAEKLQEGYCRMTEVQTASGVRTYAVTLFGALGAYLASLQTKADGTPMNLGDLTYLDADDEEFVPNETTMSLTASTIAKCWRHMGGAQWEQGAEWANVLNFCPAYNGIPEDFDADKAIVSSGQFQSILQRGALSSNTWPFPGTNEYVVTSDNAHDEWEMRDLRPYLQRPCINIRMFLDALVRFGGISFTADVQTALSRSGMWMTLGMPPRSDDYANYEMARLFDGSPSPADLLIGLCKTFGLVLRENNGAFILETRDEFYGGGSVIDLSERVDRSQSVTLTPILVSSKFYVWRNEAEGAYASEYEERWGKVYGEQRVNTGYEFDAAQKVVTGKLALRGAPQYLEASAVMQLRYVPNFAPNYPTIVAESATFKGYAQDGSASEDNAVLPATSLPAAYDRDYYNAQHPLFDVFDKPQFYGDDRTPADGSRVLVFFTGMVTMPEQTEYAQHTDQLQWRLHDDDTALLALLNEGKACWDLRLTEGERLTEMPQFSRWDIINNKSLDFGQPAEIAVPGVSVPSYAVYERMWGAYIADRYDKDTKVMRCKVRLAGLQVRQSLLRNMWWYDNSLWVLNKITNFSLRDDVPTDCEFIQVRDVSAYKQGQLI